MNSDTTLNDITVNSVLLIITSIKNTFNIGEEKLCAVLLNTEHYAGSLCSLWDLKILIVPMFMRPKTT